MLKKDIVHKLDIETKQAWDENWQNVSVTEIMEIFNYPRVKKQINIFRKYLPKDKPILEGGCGLGPYVMHLKDLGYDIVGIDYNKDPIVKAKKFREDCEFICGDILDLQFPDNYFGGYLSLGVLEHFAEGPDEAIKEANRVLKKDGVFIVIVPRLSILHKLKLPLKMLKETKFLRKLFRKNITSSYFERYFNIVELKKSFNKNGFFVIDVAPMDHEHTLLAFSDLFRDKDTYDGATKLGVRLADFLEKYFP